MLHCLYPKGARRDVVQSDWTADWRWKPSGGGINVGANRGDPKTWRWDYMSHAICFPRKHILIPLIWLEEKLAPEVLLLGGWRYIQVSLLLCACVCGCVWGCKSVAVKGLLHLKDRSYQRLKVKTRQGSLPATVRWCVNNCFCFCLLSTPLRPQREGRGVEEYCARGVGVTTLTGQIRHI